MAALWEGLAEKVKALGASWTAYTVVGSFALYLLGYLSLRFRLTALGIGTDLEVLDERYLFTGAKFLVYLITAVPTVVLLSLVPVTLLTLPYRLYRARTHGKAKSGVGRRGHRVWAWWCAHDRLALAGIVFAVVMIQFVMRQCFLFNNLLLLSDLPEPGWLRALLLDKTDDLKSLYFAGLVASTILTAVLLRAAQNYGVPTLLSRFLQGLLAFLLAVQFFLLPVNYAILIAEPDMPRVANLGGQQGLEKGQEAWLVWEGKEGVTFLIRRQAYGKEQRFLLTRPRKDITEIGIVAFDPILRILFARRELWPWVLHANDKKAQQ